MTPADQRDIPCHMTSCLAIKLGRRLARGLLLRDWLGIDQLVVGNCFHLHHLSFLGFISLFLLVSFSLQFVVVVIIIIIVFYFNY